jgi:DNA-binding CsgD family transcriptional regulator
MFHVVVLLISSALALAALILVARDWFLTRNRNDAAITLLLLSLNAVHLVGALSLIRHGTLFLFGMTAPPLAAWNAVANGSLFFTAPNGVHTLFPTRASRRLSALFFAVFVSFVVINLSGLFPVSPFTTMLFYCAIVAEACYSIAYFFFATARYPRSHLFAYREGWFGASCAIAVILSIPLVTAFDFSTILFGVVPASFSMVRWHVMLMNAAIILSMVMKKEWSPEGAREAYAVRASGDGETGLMKRLEDAGLTAREKEVFELLARGKSYKTIATELYIAESTAKSHALSVYQKIGATGRRELALFARKHGD